MSGVSIRCLFDANTGCLNAFNTTRPASDDEIVGVWPNSTLPQFGIVYNFETNMPVAATQDQFMNCISRMPHAGIPVFIHGAVTKKKRFVTNSWVRIDYDIKPDTFSDPGGSLLIKERGIYALFAAWTVAGIGYTPYIYRQIRINGKVYMTLWESKVGWGRTTYDINTMIPIMSPPCLVELWFWMGRCPDIRPVPGPGPIKVKPDPHTYNVIYKDESNCCSHLQCFKVCTDWTE